MDRRFVTVATIAVGALCAWGAHAPAPTTSRAASRPLPPRPRVLLTVGQLVSLTARLRIGLDPSNGHRPECTLVDAHVSATTAFHS